MEGDPQEMDIAASEPLKAPEPATWRYIGPSNYRIILIGERTLNLGNFTHAEVETLVTDFPYLEKWFEK